MTVPACQFATSSIVSRAATTIDEFLEDTKADIESAVPAPGLFWTNAFPNVSSGNCQGMNPSRFRWQDRGTLNGEHLSRIAGQFDAFITLDRNLAHHQNTAKLPFGIVVLGAPLKKLEDICLLIPEILEVLKTLKPVPVSRVS